MTQHLSGCKCFIFFSSKFSKAKFLNGSAESRETLSQGIISVVDERSSRHLISCLGDEAGVLGNHYAS